MTAPTVGFVGLTHLGLVSAAATAEKGFSAVGFAPDAVLIDSVSAGRLPIMEPDLDDAVARNRDRLHFTADAVALKECDVVYIAADVPTNDAGVSDLAPIESLIARARSAIRDDAVMVVLCQVPPGFTRTLSGANVFYQVETLIFGRALERALGPERFIVGCADPARPLPGAYARLLESFACPVFRMGYESAELAKIAINCFLVSSVSTTNMLAELCENIGADWNEIVPALRLDKRIGAHAYLTPGLGIGGGNLERDLATVRRLAGRHGTDDGPVLSWAHNSDRRRDWALDVLKRELEGRGTAPTVAILGLAYKADTHSTKNSPALRTIAGLPRCRFRVYDPVVPASAVAAEGVYGAASALDACAGADALAIMTPWKEFAGLDPAAVAAALSGDLVVDPYRVLGGSPKLRRFVLGAQMKGGA